MTVAETGEAQITPTPVDYDGNKPLSEIEDDIAKTRAELGETLDALERKLAPRHLLEKGVDMLRGSMDGNFEQVGETLRTKPIPLALIGAGIGWLLLSRNSSPSAVGNGATRDAHVVTSGAAESGSHSVGLTDRVKHAAEAVYEYARPKIQHTVERTTRYATEATSRAGQVVHAGNYTGEAGRTLHAARAQVSRAMDEHPLAIGVISLAAGAALALLLPSSRVEDRYLGTTRNRMLGEARHRGLEALARAEEIAGAAADAATEAVKREVAGGDHAGSRPL